MGGRSSEERERRVREDGRNGRKEECGEEGKEWEE